MIYICVSVNTRTECVSLDKTTTTTTTVYVPMCSLDTLVKYGIGFNSDICMCVL